MMAGMTGAVVYCSTSEINGGTISRSRRSNKVSGGNVFSLKCSSMQQRAKLGTKFSFLAGFRGLGALRTPRTHMAVACTGEVSERESKPFVITTPLYYANAPPHMGSAYTTIAADAYARFQKLVGRDVIFITGTDEHGEKIANAASEKGLSPKDHCDSISSDYQTLWKTLDIGYDKFIRTTDIFHEGIVKEFYRRVFDNGDIYRANYDGLYCVSCEEYKEEKDLVKDNFCPIHRKQCEHRHEENYFFALSKYQKALVNFLTENPKFVQPQHRLNEDMA